MIFISDSFFDRDACRVAADLLGLVLTVKRDRLTLQARIIETESYYMAEKASHASLGYTEKRKALFMPPGTIYMYHARGKPSLNFSARGEGNAVLIKSCAALTGDADALDFMLKNNKKTDGGLRSVDRLCSGQTLVCLSMGLSVAGLDAKNMGEETLRIGGDGYRPKNIIQTTRLGIPEGRDGHLLYRFIDAAYAGRCTKNPLTMRNKQYRIISTDEDIQKD